MLLHEVSPKPHCSLRAGVEQIIHMAEVFLECLIWSLFAQSFFLVFFIVTTSPPGILLTPKNTENIENQPTSGMNYYK